MSARHVNGPTVDADGLVVGEIELVGGLPAEDVDDCEPGDDR